MEKKLNLWCLPEVMYQLETFLFEENIGLKNKQQGQEKGHHSMNTKWLPVAFRSNCYFIFVLSF